MTNLVPCPGWTSEEDQSVHKCTEGRVDQAMVQKSHDDKPERPCRRCSKRWHKYDEEHGRRKRQEIEATIREDERMKLWLEDLHEDKLLPVLPPADLQKVMLAIERLSGRSTYPPYARQGYNYSMHRVDHWQVLRALAGFKR